MSKPAALWHRLPEDFEAQLDRSLRMGITEFHFDDGYEDILIAARELERRQLYGTFFIVTGWVGIPGFCEWEDIRKIQRAGHVVGNHTAHHVWMPKVPIEVQEEEWREADEVLLRRAGVKYGSAPRAWPYGLIGQAGEARGITPQEVRPWR